MDTRSPRDGRAIEELGTYDPMCRETDARAILKKDRIDYWLSVGAQPSQSVATLIKKYGTDGTHLEQQQAALDKLKKARVRVVPPPAPKSAPKPAEEKAAAPAAEKQAAEQQPAEKPADEPAPAAEAAAEPAKEEASEG